MGLLQWFETTWRNTGSDRDRQNAIDVPPIPGHGFRLGDYAFAAGWFRRGTLKRTAGEFIPKT